MYKQIIRVTLKRGVLSIFYKDSLALQTLYLTVLPDYLVFDVSIKNKTSHVVARCQSLNQSSANFECYLSSFDAILYNLQRLMPFFNYPW